MAGGIPSAFLEEPDQKAPRRELPGVSREDKPEMGSGIARPLSEPMVGVTSIPVPGSLRGMDNYLTLGT